MIVLIDNYDSFTYNLWQYLTELGQEVQVFRNDRVTVNGVMDLLPQAIVISPGPGRPEQAGITIELIRQCGATVPMLGVCLGHQAIAAAFGGRIVRAATICHGKTSPIYHDARTIFSDLPNPFEATRYHSLVVDPATCPKSLEVSAWTENGVIMGLRHLRYLVEGVQFHPESVLTGPGKVLLENFINYRTKGVKRC